MKDLLLNIQEESRNEIMKIHQQADAELTYLDLEHQKEIQRYKEELQQLQNEIVFQQQQHQRDVEELDQKYQTELKKEIKNIEMFIQKATEEKFISELQEELQDQKEAKNEEIQQLQSQVKSLQNENLELQQRLEQKEDCLKEYKIQYEQQVKEFNLNQEKMKEDLANLSKEKQELEQSNIKLKDLLQQCQERESKSKNQWMQLQEENKKLIEQQSLAKKEFEQSKKILQQSQEKQTYFNQLEKQKIKQMQEQIKVIQQEFDQAKNYYQQQIFQRDQKVQICQSKAEQLKLKLQEFQDQIKNSQKEQPVQEQSTAKFFALQEDFQCQTSILQQSTEDQPQVQQISVQSQTSQQFLLISLQENEEKQQESQLKVSFLPQTTQQENILKYYKRILKCMKSMQCNQCQGIFQPQQFLDHIEKCSQQNRIQNVQSWFDEEHLRTTQRLDKENAELVKAFIQYKLLIAITEEHRSKMEFSAKKILQNILCKISQDTLKLHICQKDQAQIQSWIYEFTQLCLVLKQQLNKFSQSKNFLKKLAEIQPKIQNGVTNEPSTPVQNTSMMSTQEAMLERTASNYQFRPISKIQSPSLHLKKVLSKASSNSGDNGELILSD